MGIEYKIICSQDREKLEKRLRLINGFSEYDERHRLYHFRSPENQNALGMLNASASLDPDGIYFVDHGGSTELASIVFRRLVDAAFAEADEITIREL